MTGLLVSVRNVEEALTAATAGADLIDVKEPTCGPLGRAEDAVIAAVVSAVAGRVPVSAALGELIDEPSRPPNGLTYVKCGLRGCGDDWPDRWRRWRSSLPRGCRAVAVAYADEGPALEDVAAYAAQQAAAALLIDTASKGGRNLLDHVSAARLRTILHQAAKAGMPVALAGSLTTAEIAGLLPLHPGWFAVRGAACVGGRTGRLDSERVRQLAALVHNPPCPAARPPVASPLVAEGLPWSEVGLRGSPASSSPPS